MDTLLRVHYSRASPLLQSTCMKLDQDPSKGAAGIRGVPAVPNVKKENGKKQRAAKALLPRPTEDADAMEPRNLALLTNPAHDATQHTHTSKRRHARDDVFSGYGPSSRAWPAYSEMQYARLLTLT